MANIDLHIESPSFPHQYLKQCRFTLYTPREVENFILIDKPLKTGFGSVYDLRLGAIDNKPCLTCKQNVIKCPGHYGYISLATPIVHPLFISKISQLLQLVCLKCYRCIYSNHLFEKELPNSGRIEFLINKLRKVNYCSHCMIEQRVITYAAERGFIIHGDEEYELAPAEIYFLLTNIHKDDLKFMGINIDLAGLVIFNLLVIPNPARPLLYNKELVCDDDLTLQYIEIIRHNNELRELIEKKSRGEDIATKIINDEILDIQNRINVMFNNSTINARHNVNMRPYKSISERVASKRGQIRQNGVSKRADKTARTVISPNPKLTMEELGVPKAIADELTIPERVYKANYKDVLDLWNGGKIAIFAKASAPDIKIDALKYKLKAEASPIMIGDIYWRCLQDGDWVFLNRQPTLHAPSMQAMKVKLYQYKTFSLNLSNCPVYNADMDGDEMNIHVPQTWGARVEMVELSSPKNWIISTATKSASFGLVQDGLLGAYLINEARGSEDCKKIGDFYGLTRHLLPSHLNYKSKNVTIVDGIITEGCLVKSEMGFNASGLLPYYYHKYGAASFIKFLSELQFAYVEWLTIRGYSISLKDCAPPKNVKYPLFPYESVNRFRRIMTNSLDPIKKSIAENQLYDVLENYKNEYGGAIKAAMPVDNAIIPMVVSGSKGNYTNLISINGLIGQQFIGGDPVKCGNFNQIKKLSADEFLKYNGYIFSNYYYGLDYVEYFAQSIASREAICKTATGTSVTGYLNRKLTKACENQILQYDNTIRNGKQIISWYTSE